MRILEYKQNSNNPKKPNKTRILEDNPKETQPDKSNATLPENKNKTD